MIKQLRRGANRLRYFFKYRRLGYCEYPWCGCWTLLRKQQINRSTATAWLCEECADEEQKEVQAAWDEYYSGLL